MINRDLRSVLDEMVRSQPAQPGPWEDVERARRGVRSRRLRVATTACAGVAAAALVVSMPWTTGPGSAPMPLDIAAGGPSDVSSVPGIETFVAPDWVPAATDYAPEEISADEALARCNDIVYDDGSPQSSRVEGMFDPIYAGDMVTGFLIGETGTDETGNTVPAMISCTVPGSWSGAESSTEVSPTSAMDTDGILLACSNVRQVDLRSWTVAAAMSDGYGGVAASLVSPGQGFYVQCELGPDHDEIWFSNHRPPAELHQDPLRELGASSGDSCYPSEADCAGQPHTWAGVLPAGMESAAITTADGTQIEVPVGVHGTYALRFVVPLDAPAPMIRAFDADGAIAYEGSMIE